MALFRTEGHIIERYEGFGNWTRTFPWSGQIRMDISGMGDSRALCSIIPREKVCHVMAFLFPENPYPNEKELE
ncbi:MAG: hypothetical protein AAGU15_06490 [Anaerolineaceae bacterium]